MKKGLLLLLSIYACIANITYSMQSPAYIPHMTPHLYATATLLVTSLLYTAHWFKNPTPLAVNADSIGLLTCTPVQEETKTYTIAAPWYVLVERMQQNSLPETTIMQVNSDDFKAIKLQKGAAEHPTHNTLFLFSRGYATRGGIKSGTPLADQYQDIVNTGGGLMAGHMAIKDNLVTNTPCYAFDYHDTIRYLNLGQSKDVEYLKTAWQEISQKNPHASIIGIGDCRGSKALLEFATEKPENLKALVLMAPFISLQELARHVANNYLRFAYADKVLHSLMHYALPNVNTEDDNLADRLLLIDPNIPVFIAHRKNDAVISYRDIQLLINSLQKAGNQNVYFLEVSDDASAHSRLSHIPELQQALNAFYARYNLPHNEILAKKGQELLEIAHWAAQSIGK